MNSQANTNLNSPVIGYTRLLRDRVMAQVPQRWESWALDHPHLARAIDRLKLMESAVQRWREEPEFQTALRQAVWNESKRRTAGKVYQLIERLVSRVLV